MKERLELIKRLQEYRDKFFMGNSSAHHIDLLIQDLKAEEDED